MRTLYRILFFPRLLMIRVKVAYHRWRLKRSLYLLESLDGWMRSAGYSRRDIRRFWRELAKKAEHREQLLDRLK